MFYRRFGKTNLLLSAFSLGTMRCLASEAVMEETVNQAIALGINHIETARGYGKSELYLGNILQKLDRKNFYITSKICPTENAEQMRSQIEESLTRLQIDYLDCLAIHGVNTEEHFKLISNPNGCLKAIKEALNEGKIRHLGFSTHGSLELIIKTIQTDLFEFINLHYYYFFQRHEAAIALAQEKDLGVFIISPMDKGGMLHTPPETLVELCQPFTPMELNYRFLLSDRRITTLSIGPANAEQLINPLQIANQDFPLTPDEKLIFERLEKQETETLGSDRCRQCYQCLPCPEAINIPEVLRLRNLAIAYNMTEFGQYRYQMFENAGHWFPGKKGNRCTECGDCLPRCPEQLEIPKLLKDSHQRLNGSPRRRLWEA
ncbi:MAG: aldo/keto reductase [Snowella sp.]|nr:aldo/keto reductase [Snowella sp.]